MPTAPQCPSCHGFLFFDDSACRVCGVPVGLLSDTFTFLELPPGDRVAVEHDGTTWVRCSNAFWGCNWLVDTEADSADCFACSLNRRTPDPDDTVALEKLAVTEEAKRRLIIGLRQLGLPITPYYEQEGGLAFDLLSSFSGQPVTIGHANGVITLDLAESLDAYRESIRVRLAEPYRTMLGHFRHEVGHYYQNILVTDWDECRALFGDERVSYSDAIDRHYRLGAPDGWATDHVSEYATMHPWEDFAETFAHYLHITSALWTAGAVRLSVRVDPPSTVRELDPRTVQPAQGYGDLGAEQLLEDWHWLSMFFNRVNRSLGMGDLYPFDLAPRVMRKIAYMHGLVTGLEPAR